MQRGQTDRTLALRSEFLMPPVSEFQCVRLEEISVVKGDTFRQVIFLGPSVYSLQAIP